MGIWLIIESKSYLKASIIIGTQGLNGSFTHQDEITWFGGFEKIRFWIKRGRVEKKRKQDDKGEFDDIG